MRFRKWLYLALCLALVTLSACTSGPDSRTSDIDYSPVQTSGIGTETFQLEEAYLADQTLLIQYTLDGTTYYVKTELYSEPVRYRKLVFDNKSPIRELIPLDTDAWLELAKNAESLKTLGPGQWNELLHQSFVSVTPTQCECGVVIDILQHHELFAYYDDEGTLSSVSVDYKPPGYKTVDSISYEKLVELASEQLPTVLEDTGNSTHQVLFETGETGEIGFPFALGDSESGRVLLLEHPVEKPERFASSPIVSTTKTLTHTVTGHVESFVKHPVSSLSRLFTLVTASATDILRPTPLSTLGSTPIPPVSEGPGMDLEKWEQDLDELTRRMPTSGKVHYLVDGNEFFPRLIDLVGHADKSVYLRLYIFDNDDYAIWFADFLKRRAESIDVRIIIDGLGTIGAAGAQSPSLPPGHIPPFSIVNYLTTDSNVKVKVLANPWFTGDHTKSIIIDEKNAFIGGMNIGREYRYDWHDLMIETEGPVVNELLEDFERTWIAASFLGGLRALFLQERLQEDTVDSKHYPIRVLYTRPGSSQILRTQIRAIRRAQREILLENAYITSDAIIYELAKARRRGVDVRVIIPYETDSGLISRSNAIAANTMLENGIRVYIYPGMSHIKAAVYDGWACFGSANFDNLSLRVNKELNLATSWPEAVDSLKTRVFYPDMRRSVELDQPLPHNWLDHLAELLADSL